jgi:hypothetical protein
MAVNKTSIMKLLILKSAAVFCFLSFVACSQSNPNSQKESVTKTKTEQKEAHKYGGWYCPDNLNGFPAVDIENWNEVPVVNGRMATKEETQNGTSLIHVDLDKYPNAKVLDITMPKLARFYNQSSGKNELIIVIQALSIANDSIVGFRYLNGGNGSAWLHEVDFLSDNEVQEVPSSRFVSIDLSISASESQVWKVLTDTTYTNHFLSVLEKTPQLSNEWRKKTNVNFYYPQAGNVTGQFAGNHFGMKYVQNDFEQVGKHYVEKILLSKNDDFAKIKIVCGPFASDYSEQKLIITRWANEVKNLSESL